MTDSLGYFCSDSCFASLWTIKEFGGWLVRLSLAKEGASLLADGRKRTSLNSYTCTPVPFQITCAPCRRRNRVDLGRAPRVLFFSVPHMLYFFLACQYEFTVITFFCYVALLPVNYNIFLFSHWGPSIIIEVFAIYLVYQATSCLYSRPHAAAH